MRTCTLIPVLALAVFFSGCKKNDQPGKKDSEILMGLLLPAIQRVRDPAKWEPVREGLHLAKITLTDEQYEGVKKTIGEPDIRIFIEGDTAKEGRSLPYTKLLNEKSRLIYYYEWTDREVILYRQYSGDREPGRNDEIELLSVGWGWSGIYPDFPSNMTTGEQERLMALLLPAVQKVREAANRLWEPTPDGVLAIEASLADDEYANINKAIGKPDIRIFLEGDTATNGRSLPYTTLLGDSIRTVYCLEYDQTRSDKKIVIRYQSTGSPTAGVAPMEQVSFNYTKIEF